MKFAIITYILHKEHQDTLYSYGPFIREMNIWLNSPKEIIVVAPKIRTLPNAIETPYSHKNISFRKIPAISFLSFKDVLRSLIMFPKICIQIIKAMKEADHIHLRCPGNIGLIACFIQIFFPAKPKSAKYAGNWDPKAKQPRSYKLQRWILSNTFLTRNIRVLVYGDWPEQSKNILPFFTASFSNTEIEKIEMDLSSIFKFLFVGNLVPGKQSSFAVELVQAFNAKKINAELHVYGDGEMMDTLKAQAGNNSYIHFHGNQPLEVVKQAYKEAHFLILASKSEGWPKAVAEAMFFGCIPVASGVSCVPWMLNYGSRGILIPNLEMREENKEKRNLKGVESGKRRVDSQDMVEGEVRGQSIEESVVVVRRQRAEDGQHRVKKRDLSAGAEQKNQHVIEETVERILELIKEPHAMRRMSLEAQEWSQQYTLEKFETEIKKLLVPQKS